MKKARPIIDHCKIKFWFYKLWNSAEILFYLTLSCNKPKAGFTMISILGLLFFMIGIQNFQMALD